MLLQVFNQTDFNYKQFCSPSPGCTLPARITSLFVVSRFPPIGAPPEALCTPSRRYCVRPTGSTCVRAVEEEYATTTTTSSVINRSQPSFCRVDGCGVHRLIHLLRI